MALPDRLRNSGHVQGRFYARATADQATFRRGVNLCLRCRLESPGSIIDSATHCGLILFRNMVQLRAFTSEKRTRSTSLLARR